MHVPRMVMFLAYSMHGYFSVCMFHAWLFQSMHVPCKSMHVPCMSMHVPCKAMQGYAWLFLPMHVPCMVIPAYACSMHVYVCSMHVTGNHAWNPLYHACFRCFISSRVNRTECVNAIVRVHHVFFRISLYYRV